MVRSMYSGVAGMRTHQTSLDVIGNNIANVNTYGFKGSRTTFRDIYYQNQRGASAGTAVRGGVNPSQVGVGTTIGSIDVMQTRSSFTQTDMAMDVAIDGEGFLQVMDADGNKFYTRAGQLRFDVFGNLIDSQGNFVLGVNGDPFGREADSEKIQVQLGAVDPKAAELTQLINNKEFTIKTTNPTDAGNVGVNIMSTVLPIGQDIIAEVTEGSIVVKVNKDSEFGSLEEFSEKMNAAIQTSAMQILGGDGHPAGTFTITSADAAGQDWPLFGSEITGTSYGIKLGSLTPEELATGFSVKSVGSEFSLNTLDPATDNHVPVDMTFTIDGAKGEEHVITLTIDQAVYTGTIPAGLEGSGTILLKNGGSDTDYIEVTYPAAENIEGEDYQTVTDRYIAQVQAVQNGLPAAGQNNPAVSPQTLVDVRAAVSNFKAYMTQANNSPKDVAPNTDYATNLQLLNTALNTFVATPNQTTATELVNAMTNLQGEVDVQGNLLDTDQAAPLQATATPSEPSQDLGLSSKAFVLEGGTAGGPQGINDLTGISIGTDGVIIGFHDTLGDESGRVYLGRIDLATFVNPQGLSESGNTYFSITANSGEANLTKAGQNGSGQIVSGSLELSNVDLAREFTEMIKTQRGYQANSRVITVTDTMLEELINLKR